MRSANWLSACLAFCALTLSPQPAGRGEPSADTGEILDHVDDLYRGSSSHSTMRMHVVTAQATRDLDIEQWTKGTDRFRMTILAPQKERGISTLMLRGNVWNYFPKIDKLVKLSSSMMGATWMGSHITNNDLAKRQRMRDNYAAAATFEGARYGQSVIELTLTPKPDAPVVWGKIVLVVKAEDHNPIRAFYYDDGVKLAQTVTFSADKRFGRRTLPSSMKFIPAAKPKEYTEVRWRALEFNVDVDDDKFSVRDLQK
jgi:outer membrane lipoprotein-sorting protein